MKKIFIALTLIFTISFISCSTDNNEKTVDTAVFAKELKDSIADSLQAGDTLPEDSPSFKLAEIIKGKVLADTTFVGVSYESSEYGRGHIVCRGQQTQSFNDFGESWGVAHGCLFSNGHLYEYTWWPDHYATTSSGGIVFVKSGSRYTLNDKCKC